MLRQTLSAVLIASLTWMPAAAQAGPTAAAAAGSALAGSATQSGAAATNAASSGGGASSAPIEVQVMVYGGLKQIARNIAHDTAVALRNGTLTKPVFSDADDDTDEGVLDTKEAPWKCTEPTKGSVLLQDSNSSAQITLYKTFSAYQKTLSSDYDVLIKLLTEKQTEEADKQKQEMDKLQQDLANMQSKIAALEEQLQRQSTTKPQFKSDAFQKDLGDLHQLEQQVASMHNYVGTIANQAPASTGTGTGTGSSSGGSSSTPASLQYLSGIGTELTAAKIQHELCVF